MNLPPDLTESFPQLRGVHHTAFPTWKPRSTVEFYRDGLGLRVPHAITAKGWGRAAGEHPDFLHFFFEAGENSLIAFFYYVGTQPNPAFTAFRGQYLGLARHTAWTARDVDELERWRSVIKRTGAKVTPVVRHETLASIYFQDPNGYDLEIACQLRPIEEIDVVDANLTIDAMVETFGDDNPDGQSIQDMWKKKAELVRRYMESAKQR